MLTRFRPGDMPPAPANSSTAGMKNAQNRRHPLFSYGESSLEFRLGTRADFPVGQSTVVALEAPASVG